MINPARKEVVIHRASAAFQPCWQAGSSIRKQIELDWPARFLLHYDCPLPDLTVADNIANLHPDKVTAPKLAVDCQVEQCSISQATVLIEVKSDLPNFLFGLSARFAPTVLPAFQAWRLVDLVSGISMIVLRGPEWPPEECSRSR